MVRIDTQDLGPDEGYCIPPGKYRFTVVAVHEKVSKGGDMMWELDLMVVHPPEVRFQSKTWVVFIEPRGPRPSGAIALAEWSKRAQAARLWRDKIHALGLTITVGTPFEAKPDDVAGRLVDADVVDGQYDGKKRSEIKRLHRVEDQGAATPQWIVGVLGEGRPPLAPKNQEGESGIVDVDKVPF